MATANAKNRLVLEVFRYIKNLNKISCSSVYLKIYQSILYRGIYSKK